MKLRLAVSLLGLLGLLGSPLTGAAQKPSRTTPARKATTATKPAAKPKPAAKAATPKPAPKAAADAADSEEAADAAAPAAAPAAGGTILIEQPTEWNANTRGLTVVSRKSVHVVGTATHASAIERVELNGARMAVQPIANGVRFSGYMAVDSETNSAEIVAFTAEGQRFSSKYKVTPPTPIAASAPKEPPASPQAAFEASAGNFKGKRWAVIVGVSQYRDPRISGLKYADADAKSMYNFLRSERSGMGGFAPENIKMLLNQDATFRNIRVALFDFLKGATEEDVVYIYFAGHGSPDPDRPENMYLIPYDADAGNLSGTGLPMEDISTAVKRLHARHKVVIADACHSAGVSAGNGTRSLMNGINRAFTDQMMASTGGLAMFTASEANQYSQEGPQWGGGHGVFTHYMIEALKGAADEDQDHIVSLGEMMEWVRTRVRRETRNAQIPNIGPTSFDRTWPMAVVLPGTEIRQISDEEIQQEQRTSTVMSSAYDSPWLAPDSVIAVVGMTDSLRVRLDNPGRDVLPSHQLTWTSSSPQVARVDGSGVVHAESPGTAQITATGFNRRVSVPVRVYGRPSQVAFTPTDTALTAVIGEPIRVSVDMLIGTDVWLRGLTPTIAPADSFVLAKEGPGKYMALREGQVRLTGTIAGNTRSWNIKVVPPRVKIPATRRVLLLGDSLQITPQRTRPDGSVLGPAAGVAWRSDKPEIAAAENGLIRARGIGKTRVLASLGTSTDSISFSVLGDLLVSTTGKGGRTIRTVSLKDGKSIPLPADVQDSWSAALSPDGQQIAFISSKETRSPRLYVMNVDGSDRRRVVPDQKGALGFRMSAYEEHTPSWSSDGRQIVFVSNSPGNYEVFSIAPDGTGLARVTDANAVDWRVSTAPDVPRIAFERVVAAGDADLVVALPDGSEPRVLTSFSGSQRVREGKPKLLPGGTQLVYARGGMNLDESAGETLSVMEVSSGSTLRDLVQPLKGHELIFGVSPDGSRIAYHQHGRWNCNNTSVVVIDLAGAVLKNINLGAGVDVREINWGATPVSTAKESQ